MMESRANAARTAVALAAIMVLGVTVGAPLWLASSAAGVFFGTAVLSEVVGPLRLEDPLSEEAVVLGLLLFAAVFGAALYARFSEPSDPPLRPATWRGRAGAWARRNPWWVAGCAFLVIARFSASRLEDSPLAVGAFATACLAWVGATAVLLTSRALWRGLRSCISVGRRSGVAAGALATAAAVASGAWVTAFGLGSAVLDAVQPSLATFSAYAAETGLGPPASLLSDDRSDPPEEPTPQALGAAASAGLSFEECIDRLSGRPRTSAVALARSMVAVPADAEDVVQDAILNMCDGHRDIPDLEGLLLTVTRRRAIDRQRRPLFYCPREPDPDAPVARCPYGTPEEVLLRQERYAILNRATCSLPPVQLATLERRVAGDSDAEIARDQGISENAVQQRISRAVATLRERWKVECESELQ